MIGATFCSGIGAPEVAAPWVDWRLASEIEPFPRAVLVKYDSHQLFNKIECKQPVGCYQHTDRPNRNGSPEDHVMADRQLAPVGAFRQLSPTKRCAMCGDTKAVDDFHRSGKRGRHSYCKPCLLSRPRERKKTDRTEANLQRRYGLSVDLRNAMLSRQGGVCAICRQPPARICVDHCHSSGAVRGILCHPCNVKLAAVDDAAFLAAALTYLGAGEC